MQGCDVTLADLEFDEQVALLGLLKVVAWADRVLTALEKDELRRVMAQMGPSGEDALQQAIIELKTLEDVREKLVGVRRREAQELMTQVCSGLARTDGVDPAETDFLDWMTVVWHEVEE
jgi:hypothetical protein